MTAVKHDQNKPTISLISHHAVFELAKVLDFGAKKYSTHNWREGFLYSRCLSAALRHILAYNGGEDLDPESNLSHLAHAMCNLMFLLEFQATGTGSDDRYKTKK